MESATRAGGARGRRETRHAGSEHVRPGASLVPHFCDGARSALRRRGGARSEHPVRRGADPAPAPPRLPGPALVVRGLLRGTRRKVGTNMKKILVALDGSPRADRVLAHRMALAELTGQAGLAPLLRHPRRCRRSGPPRGLAARVARIETDRYLRVRGEGPGTSWTKAGGHRHRMARVATPPRTNVDLVVIGSRLLGSTTSSATAARMSTTSIAPSSSSGPPAE